jgi:ABC-type amino acid transport substrate-binding protein
MGLSRLLAFTVVVAASVPTCLSAADSGPGALAAVKARGKLVMVCFPHQDTPFVHVNLARGPMKRAAFAKTLGVELEIRPISTPSYAELIPALLAGQGDLIASSFSSSAERAQQVDFSDPYFEVYQAVLVRSDGAIAAPRDLAGKRAVVVPGTIMEAKIRELGIPESRIRREGFTRDVLLAVVNKAADFTVYELDEYGSATPLLKEFSALKVAFRLGTPETYSIAVPKGSDLRPAINDFLAKVKSSGELASIIKKNVNPHT